MDEKIPWAFELYESEIMAESSEEALKIIRKHLKEYSEMSLSELRESISMWDQL